MHLEKKERQFLPACTRRVPSHLLFAIFPEGFSNIKPTQVQAERGFLCGFPARAGGAAGAETGSASARARGKMPGRCPGCAEPGLFCRLRELGLEHSLFGN